MMTSQAAYGNKTNSTAIQQASSQSQAILLKNQRMLSNSININPKKKMNVQTTFDVDFYAEKAQRGGVKNSNALNDYCDNAEDVIPHPY